jgi:hypothetical protein
LIAVLCAWLLATGAQWDLVQTLGWGRMFVRYAATMPVFTAAKKTFAGELCRICRTVDDARQEERREVPAQDGLKTKVLLVCPPAPQFVFAAPAAPSRAPEGCRPLSAEPAAPPTPPPRAA